jgi:hypothetical protein
MRTCRSVLVLAAAAVWADAARPAEPIVPEGTTVKLILLRQKSVQQELAVAPDLAKKIMDFTEKQHLVFQEVMKLGQDERRQKFEELEKQNKQFLADNLEPRQAKRLHQIAMQLAGLVLVGRAEVAKELKLTEDQQHKCKELRQEAGKQLEAIMQEKDRATRRDKLVKLRKETREKVHTLLTDQQKAKARELLGEPFEGEITIEEGPSPSKTPQKKVDM